MQTECQGLASSRPACLGCEGGYLHMQMITSLQYSYFILTSARVTPQLCSGPGHHDISSALQASTLYKLFESKVVLNVRGTWYFLRGTWYFAQNRMLVVMAGSGEAQKPYF